MTSSSSGAGGGPDDTSMSSSAAAATLARTGLDADTALLVGGALIVLGLLLVRYNREDDLQVDES